MPVALVIIENHAIICIFSNLVKKISTLKSSESRSKILDLSKDLLATSLTRPLTNLLCKWESLITLP